MLTAISNNIFELLKLSIPSILQSYFSYSHLKESPQKLANPNFKNVSTNFTFLFINSALLTT